MESRFLQPSEPRDQRAHTAIALLSFLLRGSYDTYTYPTKYVGPALVDPGIVSSASGRPSTTNISRPSIGRTWFQGLRSGRIRDGTKCRRSRRLTLLF